MYAYCMVSRPKLGGPGRHFGVAELDSAGHLTRVHELQRDGYREIAFSEFAQGRPTHTVDVIRGPLAITARARLSSIVGRPLRYHLAKLNCESFARWVMYGSAESKQVTVASVAAGLGALLLVLAKMEK